MIDNEDRHEPEDLRLNELLRALPRERADIEFKARVLARLAQDATTLKPRASFWQSLWERPGLVALAACALLALAFGWREIRLHEERRETLEQIATLRIEYDNLAQRLEAVKREKARIEPVIHLGGSEELELVLDLGSVQEQPMAQEGGEPKAQDWAALLREAQDQRAQTY
jgi:hypothetical protein